LKFVLSIFSILILSTISNAQQALKKDKFNYTFRAIEKQIEGTVYITFLINKEGIILDDSIKVVQGLGFGLDEIAVEVLKNMPNWNPMTKKMVKKNGDYTRFSIPIKFSLDQIGKKEWSNYYFQKAELSIHNGNESEGLSLYNKSLEFFKNNMETLQSLINLLEEIEHFDEAKKYKKRLMRLSK
jgi:TonB family protein